jgi:putative FmdB family regulatory protein
MPIYEYRRPDGTTFEVQQSFSDEPLKLDPDTGVPVERVLHAPAVHFKGKGFYNTDYGTRRRNRETAAAAEKPSAGEGSSSDAKANSDTGGGGGEKKKDTAKKDPKPVASTS